MKALRVQGGILKKEELLKKNSVKRATKPAYEIKSNTIEYFLIELFHNYLF